jgi:hypothetical protein
LEKATWKDKKEAFRAMVVASAPALRIQHSPNLGSLDHSSEFRLQVGLFFLAEEYVDNELNETPASRNRAPGSAGD